MKIIFILAIILNFNSLLYAADHSHQESQKSDIQLDHGKKWATDAPLRLGMDNINKLAKESLPTIRNGKFNDESYHKLGLEISKQTDHIFKNCKLAPAADKELHKILIPIMAAKKVFIDKNEVTNKQAAYESLLKALKLYGEHFQHEGWAPVQ